MIGPGRAALLCCAPVALVALGAAQKSAPGPASAALRFADVTAAAKIGLAAEPMLRRSKLWLISTRRSASRRETGAPTCSRVLG